jgi:fucose permease
MKDPSPDTGRATSTSSPPLITAPALPPRTRQVTVPIHIGFLLVGVVNILLGPILPLLSARWSLNDAQAGHLFIAQFAGAIVGAALSGMLMERFGAIAILTAGYAGLALTTATLPFSPWLAGVIAITMLGFSLSLTNVATNLLVSQLNPERRAAALNLLNLIWGAGAVSCSWLISILAAGDDLSWPLGVLASCLTLAALWLSRCRLPAFATAADDPTGPPESPHRRELHSYLLLTNALVFIYVGPETAIGGWMAVYVRRLDATGRSSWALTTSLFWAGLLIGRAAAPLFLRLLSEAWLVLSTLAVAVGGMLIILMGEGLVPVSIGSSVTGFGLAAVFPTTFALFTHRLGSQAAQLAGLLFVMESLGGAILPWLVGWASNIYGELRIGLIVPLLGSLIMIALQGAIILNLSGRRRAQPSTG